MEIQDDDSISKISNKDNFYRFDNYGNVVADSIEDLLYDKYTKKNNEDNDDEEEEDETESLKEKNKDLNEISLSSSLTENKNEKYKNKNDKSKNKSNSFEKDEKLSGNNDKFLESIIQESKSENIENKNIEKSENEMDKFINSLEGNDIYPDNNEYYEKNIKHKFKNKIINKYKKNNNSSNKKDKVIKIIMNVSSKEKKISKKIKKEYNEEDEEEEEESNDIHLNSNLNIKNNQNENDKNSKSYSHSNTHSNMNFEDDDTSNKNNNKDYKNILQNKNINEITESTKINSKKSNTLKSQYIKQKNNINLEKLKKIRNIRKIHLNSPNEKSKILKSNKLISNVEGIKNDNNYIIKLNLNLNESKMNEEENGSENKNKNKNNIMNSPNSNQFNINKYIQIKQNTNMHKLIPKKSRIFITKAYNKNINYIKEPFLNVVNDRYFCTKEIGKINIIQNYKKVSKTKNDDLNKKNKNIKQNNSKSKNKIKNNNNTIDKNKKNNYNNKEYDSDKTDIFNEQNKKIFNFKQNVNNDKYYDNEEEIIHNNKNKNKYKKEKYKQNSLEKKKSKEETKDPEMWTEFELDKNRNPKNIRIKINNPLIPLYQLFKKEQQQFISLNKIHKSQNKYKNSNLFKEYLLNKDFSNQNNIKINKKNLAPIKLKRRTKTNSTSSIYTTKSDHIIGVNDYNYFNNREIAEALAHKNGRNCEGCLFMKNQKKNFINNKFNVKTFEPGLRNNFFNEEKYRIIRKISNERKNDNYSYNNHNRKINNIRGSRGKNKSITSNSSLSSKYANVINIEFPALSSYFHGKKEK